ncbi:hypothetical protein KCU61_g567, partial [Aureobasidium melanogenum]
MEKLSLPTFPNSSRLQPLVSQRRGISTSINTVHTGTMLSATGLHNPLSTAARDHHSCMRAHHPHYNKRAVPQTLPPTVRQLTRTDKSLNSRVGTTCTRSRLLRCRDGLRRVLDFFVDVTFLLLVVFLVDTAMFPRSSNSRLPIPALDSAALDVTLANPADGAVLPVLVDVVFKNKVPLVEAVVSIEGLEVGCIELRMMTRRLMSLRQSPM